MSGTCTDPRRGSVWVTDATGRLRKVSSRSVIGHVRHPVTGNIVQIRHWRQLERLERAAERNGGVFEGHAHYTPASEGADTARAAATTFFNDGITSETCWVGTTNAEAMRGRRAPRRIALIRSLATLDPQARADTQLTRRVSEATARTVDWVHDQLEHQAVTDVDIVERLGYETRIALLETAARAVSLPLINRGSRSAPARQAQRRRVVLEKLDKLGFGADELGDLVIDQATVRDLIGANGHIGRVTDGYAATLLDRIKQNQPAGLDKVATWSEGRLNKADSRVELYGEILASCRDHPVLGQLPAPAAMWLATSNVTVDDRLDISCWEQIASDIALVNLTRRQYRGYRQADGPQVRGDDDERFVDWALQVDGDCVKYHIVSALARAGANYTLAYRGRVDIAGDIARRGLGELDATTVEQLERTDNYAHVDEVAEHVIGKLAGMKRQEAVLAHGTLSEAAWAHTLSAGLSAQEAHALALAVVGDPDQGLCRDNPGVVDRIRALPTGAFAKALSVASADHDEKWAGHDLAVVDGDDRIIVDELGFKHRTRRRSRRNRRAWHPSAVDSAARLAYCFGKAWPKYLEAGQRASRAAQNRDATVHELTYWLPTGENAGEFGQWITSKRRVQAIFTGQSGEIGLRRVAEEFDKLSDEQKRDLGVAEAVSWLRAQGYGGLGLTPMGQLAAALDVPPGQLTRICQRWPKALGTVSAFPLDRVWEDENSGLTARFLPRSDPRGLYLGHLTDCCQYPGSAGESCAWAGVEKPLHGFFVVEDRNGNILAQSWVWSDGNGGMCFDNVERKTSTADGWNAHWGVGNAPDPDAVIDGLDWEAMSSTQRRSWTIRALYQKAAGDCLDRFDTVTMGVSMTKIPLDGFTRATTPLTPHDYTGYRDSQQQAVLAKRTRKGAMATVNGYRGGFAWDIGASAKQPRHRIAVENDTVTVTCLDDGELNRDAAKARAVELLSGMGPRHWQLSYQDKDGQALGGAEQLDIDGDARLAVADKAEYEVAGDYNADDEAYQHRLRRTRVTDDDTTRALWQAGMDNALGAARAMVADPANNVTVEHFTSLSDSMREALDEQRHKLGTFAAAIADGRLAELDAGGTDAQAALLLVGNLHGATLSVNLATTLATRYNVTVDRLDGAPAAVDVIKLLATADETDTLALLERVDDFNQLTGLTAVPDRADLDSLTPYLEAGSTMAEAVTLHTAVDGRDGWTPADVAYKIAGGKDVAAVAYRKGIRSKLANAGIKAKDWAKLPARVQVEVTGTRWTDDPDGTATNPALTAAARLLTAAEASGFKTKSAARYPHGFTVHDIATAVEAGVTPDMLWAETPGSLSGDDLTWLAGAGAQTVASRVWRHPYHDRDWLDETGDLDEDTVTLLKRFDQHSSASGLRALEACGINAQEADACPSDWSAAQVIRHHRNGKGATTAVAYKLLSSMPHERVDVLVDAGLDGERAAQLDDGWLNTVGAAAAAMAGVTDQEASELHVSLLHLGGHHYNLYHVTPETILDARDTMTQLVSAYRKAKQPATFAAVAELVYSCMDLDVTGGALDELAGVDNKNLQRTAGRAAHAARELRWSVRLPYRGDDSRQKATRNDMRQLVDALEQLHSFGRLGSGGLSVHDAIHVGRLCADTELEAVALAGRASACRVTPKHLSALDRCGIDRVEQKALLSQLDQAGWDWVFEDTSTSVRSNSKAGLQVADRAKTALAASKAGVDADIVGQVSATTGLGAKKAAKALAKIDEEDREVYAHWTGDNSTAGRLLVKGARGDELTLAGAIGVTGRQAEQIVDWVWDEHPVDSWARAGATYQDLEALTAGGWKDIDGLSPEAAVELVRAGETKDTVQATAQAAKTAGIDTRSFDRADWQLATAGGDLLAGGSDPRATALKAAGMDSDLADTIARSADRGLLGDDRARVALARLADDEHGARILEELAHCGGIDDIDAAATVIEHTDIDTVRQLVETAGRDVPASVVAEAVTTGDSDTWMRDWAGTRVPSDLWVEASQSGLTAQQADDWYQVCDTFTPRDVANLVNAGVDAGTVAGIDTDADTLIAAARTGLLDDAVRGATGDELAGVIESGLGRDAVEQLLGHGATWSQLAGGEAAVLWRRGIDSAHVAEILSHLDAFPVHNAASLGGRMRSFTAAGLDAEDAGWYTDCSAAQAKALADQGCDGPTYGQFLRRYRDLGLGGDDDSPAARRRQIQRWVSSGVEHDTAGQVNAKAEHHAATLR
jgi:hypothetical protein